MNKYILLIITAVVLILGGVAYKKFLAPEGPALTGVTREITVLAKKDQWSFTPELIEVNQGDKLILTIINEDNYDHGIAIDAYGISQRIPANGTIKAEFTATKAGDFPFYCSVPCGAGIVEGVERGHFDQIGKIRVAGMVRTDSDEGQEIQTPDDLRRRAVRIESDRVATAQGYSPEASEVLYDDGNVTWQDAADGTGFYEGVTSHAGFTSEEEAFLIGKKFQAIRYTLKDVSKKPLWVFIDSDTGEPLGTLVEN